ncbi:TetR/AcrR family transcriptional regulator [Streptomyces sp. NPDC021093]|uniref:TetR/AcrR family transcriptional regulator n=1 Tax=Streptomyces sp. NPDC021093 TaxID=3365112 RepID=UPI0037B9DDA7
MVPSRSAREIPATAEDVPVTAGAPAAAGDVPAAAEDVPAVAPPARRPGGRSARIRTQVLDAVRAELVEHGYDALTVDTVADRAGVHRTTVYRRWQDVGGLLADVLDVGVDDGWQPADTGSLFGDLAALNHEIQSALTEQRSVTAALIAASFRSGQAADALRDFWENRYAQCEITVHRAVGRGELPPHTEARPLLVTATAPLYHHLVLLRAVPDPDLPDRAARTAVLAATAGAFAREGDCQTHAQGFTA